MNPLRQAGLDALGFSERQVERLLWSFVALGVALRALLYLLQTPIWTDEAKLATSLLDRGYAGLLEPLDHGQVATFLFMYVQKTSTIVFGFSALSLRLFPVLAGIAGVILMRHVARRVLTGAPLLFSVALFAVSYYPVRHSAELKPYATDLLASLVLTAVALEWLDDRSRIRWLWCFATVAPIAVVLSYPAVFVACGIVAALAVPVWRERRWSSRVALGAAGLLVAGTFVGNYLRVAAQQYDRSRAMPWVDGFPPWDDLPRALAWFFRAHTGRTFGYPIGDDGGGSMLTFLAFVCGAIVLWRAPRRALLAVLLCPFAVGFSAAVLHRYPYGGSGRVSQYMVPAICLLAGLGAARFSSVAKRSVTRRRVQRGVLTFFLLFGVTLGSAALLRPYRDRADLIGRDFARWFWDVKSRDAVLVCASEDLGLEFARLGLATNPGGPSYRVNQRIYFERLRRGEPPDLAGVSVEHPLRVVFLGSLVRSQPAALEAWLRTTQERYELIGREQHRIGPYREQHGREEWAEMFTFAPRDPEQTRPR